MNRILPLVRATLRRGVENTEFVRKNALGSVRACVDALEQDWAGMP
ncbi:MAG TPA: hypothetical protein VNU68_09780 [Verrucomicrobiae bacterium]|nr:hypothetical protein [Verrucomicrobiae bacterium]